MARLFAVTRSRGSTWAAERPMEAQDEWPLDGTPDVLLIARANDEDEIRSRLADDSWTRTGLLRIEQIVPWTLRLGTLGPSS